MKKLLLVVALLSFAPALYGELLNATNHNNPRFAFVGVNAANGQFVVFTNDGIPITPTALLTFDF